MIIDDEPEAIVYLSMILKEEFPQINIISTSNSFEDATNKVGKLKPNVIFLDIQLNENNGFDVIKYLSLNNISTYIIFVTAFENYAIEAFKTNALAYLVKPVEAEDLRIAVNKFMSQKEKDTIKTDLLHILNHFHPKIRFNTRTGFILVPPDEIVYCESDGNYSTLYLTDNSKKVVCLNLNTLLQQINHPKFKRISRYFIINLDFLTELDRRKKACSLANNGHIISLKYSPKFFKE
ncbi:LytR/AlgR family response regulator transcription factor [Saccharicrinis sp. FJH2]|uniref:LytR/AlgR family response regulator transcription factor n=1 Tax=Saccharicrinis sp. FJH65 TaxID=3344659 RepID=UPI0035F22B11